MDLDFTKVESNDEREKPVVVRNVTDLQRLKLEKLMKNPEKPIIIPERPKERGMPVVPEFVRNVMGSSAGAGSGEFHVYRHLRRKEYARQKFMKEKGERERLEDDYHQKLENNKKIAEEKTAKKRAKRLKQKMKLKNKKKVKHETKQSSSEESESSEEEEEEDEVKEESDNDKGRLTENDSECCPNKNEQDKTENDDLIKHSSECSLSKSEQNCFENECKTIKEDEIVVSQSSENSSVKDEGEIQNT